MASLKHLTITADADWIALVAYRVALEEIVREADMSPWADNPAAEVARRVLEAFPGRP